TSAVVASIQDMILIRLMRAVAWRRERRRLIIGAGIAARKSGTAAGAAATTTLAARAYLPAATSVRRG
ncbi:MAG: hypothetical protein ACYC4J_10165, partial [Gemmatimonadaceae bacterium]